MRIAATWIKGRRAGERSRAKAIGDVVAYVSNPEKTDGGALSSGYECDPATAAREFELSHKLYDSLTGRKQSNRDVFCYHLRQSFKPGEISPAEANRIGYELAMRFTRGKHQFAVFTHTDKSHIHNHIILNSVTLDCKRKFRNFIGSAFVLRHVSDLICAEHGLSVIEKPKPRKGRNYGTWLDANGGRVPSQRDALRVAIDIALSESPKTFDDFVSLLVKSGYEVKRGKHVAFRENGKTKFLRLDGLGGDYSEAAIRGRFGGVKSKRSVSLLVDIEAKIKQGKSAGYERWAQTFNVKQAAETLVFLKEQSIGDVAMFTERVAQTSERFAALSKQLNALDVNLKANSELQKQIATYAKTKATYDEYRKSGYSKAFRVAHETDILLHQASKQHFDSLGIKKLPKIATLREEYAATLDEKRRGYRKYKSLQAEQRQLLIVQSNVERLLNTPTDARGERER